MEEPAGELDHLINQEVNIQTVGPDGAQIVSPDEDLTDDGGLESPEPNVAKVESRKGRSRERFAEPTTKILRRHSADAPLNRRTSFGSSDYVGTQPHYQLPQYRGRSASPYAGRSESVSRKATFVDGEYIPESTSLFRPTQARVSSMQAVYDRKQEKTRTPQSVKVDPNYVPSDRLLRTTSARVLAQQAWVEHQKEVELQKQTPTVKIDETYKPSDRLMKTTKGYQAAVQGWEKEREDRRLADDIWWEKRKTPDVQKSAKKIAVSSKLTEPTKAYLASKRPKAPNGEESPMKHETPRSPPPPISSHLLKPTAATIQGTWKVAHEKELHPEEPPKPVLQLATKNSNIHAKSKLFEETSAAKSKKKIFDPEPRARSPSPSRTTKELSAHLLANPKARSKSPQVKKDPRESQWNSYATLSASKSELLQAQIAPIHHSGQPNHLQVSTPARRNSFDGGRNGTTPQPTINPAASPKLRPDTLHRLATPKHVQSPVPSAAPGTPSRGTPSTAPTAPATSASARKVSTSRIPGPSPSKHATIATTNATKTPVKVATSTSAAPATPPPSTVVIVNTTSTPTPSTATVFTFPDTAEAAPSTEAVAAPSSSSATAAVEEPSTPIAVPSGSACDPTVVTDAEVTSTDATQAVAEPVASESATTPAAANSSPATDTSASTTNPEPPVVENNNDSNHTNDNHNNNKNGHKSKKNKNRSSLVKHLLPTEVATAVETAANATDASVPETF